MGFIKTLGETAANAATGGLLSAGMGLLLGKSNDQRQIEQQQKLQDMQIKGQKEMTEFNYGKQLEMWNNTNYEAQMKHIKDAGLNPGLLYGMSGGGGVTTGGASGSVNGGNAPVGGGEIQGIMGLMSQQQMLEAQRANIEANTEKTKAETANLPKTGENIEASTQSLLAGVESTRARTQLTKVEQSMKELELAYNKETFELNKETLDKTLQKIGVELDIMQNEKTLSNETLGTKITQIKTDLLSTIIDNTLKKWQTKAVQVGMDKTRAETTNIKQNTELQINQINKIAAEISNMQGHLSLEQLKTTFMTEHPGIGQVMGENLNSFLEDIQKAGTRVTQKLSQFLPW